MLCAVLIELNKMSLMSKVIITVQNVVYESTPLCGSYLGQNKQTSTNKHLTYNASISLCLHVCF